MKRYAAIAFVFFALGLLTQQACASEANEDAMVIEQLLRAGSNLSKPHAVDFYVYLPSRRAADTVAAQLAKHGYTVRVRPSAAGDMRWLALASRSMLLSVESIGNSAAIIRQVSAPHKGDYDGWEAGVVK
ncbi:ribonuclease E inhibitor RraB [Methylibium rhizosphaerae]|uniref:ribonuclease E inhibitor RraB n=1 Tax=Methylibium rhizosphaerae TaxID=2570323 RepID=UPI0015E3DBBA|nr:ribonuclease E inhibitor RraB [Methylibium rhizosphaerae]